MSSLQAQASNFVQTLQNVGNMNIGKNKSGRNMVRGAMSLVLVGVRVSMRQYSLEWACLGSARHALSAHYDSVIPNT